MACRGSPLSRSLSRVKRKWAFALHLSAYDPKRMLGGAKSSSAFDCCCWQHTLGLLSVIRADWRGNLRKRMLLHLFVVASVALTF
jgi:hypothetical protein